MTTTTQPPAPSLETLLELLQQRGGGRYGGEPVSEFEHALQCAMLAEAGGHPPSVITAALLHDVGHLLLEEDDASAAERGVDMHHEAIGARALAPLFGDAVAAPVRLHVAAKRYLCATQAGYFDTLSPASVTSLQAQGGIFSDTHAEHFAALPYAQEAIAVRRFDDAAKVSGASTPPLAHFAAIARTLAA